MNEFLNSKSMVTPGIAGVFVTLVTATLSSQFGAPAKWTAVITSVLLALLIFFADKAGQMAVRVIMLLLNAVVIFSMAVGTNTSIAAAKAGPKPNPPFESAPAPTPTPFINDWFSN